MLTILMLFSNRYLIFFICIFSLFLGNIYNHLSFLENELQLLTPLSCKSQSIKKYLVSFGELSNLDYQIINQENENPCHFKCLQNYLKTRSQFLFFNSRCNLSFYKTNELISLWLFNYLFFCFVNKSCDPRKNPLFPRAPPFLSFFKNNNNNKTMEFACIILIFLPLIFLHLLI